MLVPNGKEGVYLQGPIQFDYGVFTTIGEGSVIGAGSVVTRDIPSGVVAAGAYSYY